MAATKFLKSEETSWRCLAIGSRHWADCGISISAPIIYHNDMALKINLKKRRAAE